MVFIPCYEFYTMKLELSIGFNDMNTWFSIDNPIVIPMEGEGFSCKWSDYISDKKAIKELNEFSEYDIHKVHIIDKEYSKDKVVINISLFSSDDYEHYYS